MFHNSPTDARARPLGRNFMVRALLPWDMFFNAMTRRKTRFLLSALDDLLLAVDPPEGEGRAHAMQLWSADIAAEACDPSAPEQVLDRLFSCS